jgi:hypothetical protein
VFERENRYLDVWFVDEYLTRAGTGAEVWRGGGDAMRTEMDVHRYVLIRWN